MAVDKSGNVVLASSSTGDFTTPGSFQPVFHKANCPDGLGHPQSCPDGYVTKFDPNGNRVLWATFLGGNGSDSITASTLDADGNIFVTGVSDSTDFPVSNGAFQQQKAPGRSRNVFVAKLSVGGDRLLYSTFLGGNGSGTPVAIRIDSNGQAVVAGTIDSAEFTLPGSGLYRCGVPSANPTSSFVATLSPNGDMLASSLVVCGLIVADMALTAAGAVVMAGGRSAAFGVSPGALNVPQAGIGIVKATSTNVEWAAAFGTGQVKGIAVDLAGDIVMTGHTSSIDFPLVNAFQASFPGGVSCPIDSVYTVPCRSAFVTKFHSSGTSSVFSTYLGGRQDTVANGLALDSAGRIFVVGFTSASNFPKTDNSMQPCNGAISNLGKPRNGFLTRFSLSGGLEYSTYFGNTLGNEIDSVFAMKDGQVIVNGYHEYDPNLSFPHTSGSGGYYFVAKIHSDAPMPVVPRVAPACVFNAASLMSARWHGWEQAPRLAGPVAPGEIISLFGSELGPRDGIKATIEPGGRLPFALAGVRVLFDGAQAPMLYAQYGQINLVAPFSLEGKTSAVLQVERDGLVSEPINVQVVPAVFGIFTQDGSGSGPAAVLNEDGTVNSPDNPAERGSIISIFGTGGGQTSPEGSDGAIATAPLKRLTHIFDVYISSSVGSRVLYEGPAPDMVEGAIQISAQVPDFAVRGRDQYLIVNPSGLLESATQNLVRIAIK